MFGSDLLCEALELNTHHKMQTEVFFWATKHSDGSLLQAWTSRVSTGARHGGAAGSRGLEPVQLENCTIEAGRLGTSPGASRHALLGEFGTVCAALCLTSLVRIRTH